jgi:hypothetical protein
MGWWWAQKRASGRNGVGADGVGRDEKRGAATLSILFDQREE